jgi:hypothetical protein
VFRHGVHRDQPALAGHHIAVQVARDGEQIRFHDIDASSWAPQTVSAVRSFGYN